MLISLSESATIKFHTVAGFGPAINPDRDQTHEGDTDEREVHQ